MTDVLIVGAGPAGLSAAISCAERGLQVQVIDEFMRPGGRLLGQLYQEPDGSWWNGIEEAAKLQDKAASLGVELQLGISVIDLNHSDDGWMVYTSTGILKAPALLLATGAAETACPIPGWTLPGVMSIGAAQVMTNVHRVRVGMRGVIVGINVLSMAIAQELELAGIKIAAMVLPAKNMINNDAGDPRKVMQSIVRLGHLAPSPLLRLGSGLMRYTPLQSLGLHLYPKGGVKVWGIPVQLRKAAVEIEGIEKVESVRVANLSPDGNIVPGTSRSLPVDFVCMAGGLYPLAELAAVAGCPFRYIPELGGHIPLHNARMQTPLAGLFVAGNITGVESAKIAAAQGTVAGLSIAAFHQVSGTEEDLRESIQNLRITRAKASIQFHPQVAEGRQRLESMYSENFS
ncbi:NAD(P)/FAD-dependent oxidoreductase [Paenibacillus donghaensis]|uniref:NAD(P)/FAD-dependent oxidoreductase n=1 Tax=Paenibacillus donghaensis TaxID=414771 RepID=UPI0018843069|nr:NAD(P)/FAD-dependent oxidoreductase [Paenibacillus donghaensis]MBE9917027.1 NAD(P)/FAD-dependent oxidoreductase [Paenibacillus donghaensis]